MPKKHLVVKKPQNCIGCKICSLASSFLSSDYAGISSGFITVSGSKKDGFDISIDRAKKTDYPEIVKLCPRKCFEIVSVE